MRRCTGKLHVVNHLVDALDGVAGEVAQEHGLAGVSGQVALRFLEQLVLLGVVHVGEVCRSRRTGNEG